MKTYKIYAVRNEITGELYIGITYRTIKKRFTEHKKKTSGCPKLAEAMELWGEDFFTIEQIDSAPTKSYAYVLEIYYIKVLNTKFPYGYNFTDGGLYYPLEKEVRKKISNSNGGQKRSDEFKEKCRKRMISNQFAKGFFPSEETLLKRSKALKGRIFTIEHRENLSKALKGRTISKEHSENLRISNTGCVRTDEFKEKTSIIQRNKEPKGEFRGVCYIEKKKKWVAGIKILGKRKYLGYYLTVEEAAIAWNEAADKYWGEGVGYRNKILT